MKHVETLEGIGTVTTSNGGQVRVRYELDVMQEQVYVGPGRATLPGMKEITGRVRTLGGAEAIGVFSDILTLAMADGRKLHRWPRKDRPERVARLKVERIQIH